MGESADFAPKIMGHYLLFILCHTDLMLQIITKLPSKYITANNNTGTEEYHMNCWLET